MTKEPIVRRAARIHVVVMTYNRPDTVRRLLSDVLAWADEYEVSVAVYDDASDEDYSEVVALCERQGFDYVRAGHNHGKRGFWRWVGRMYNDQRGVRADYWYVVADDYRLCEDFFRRAIGVWSSIPSRRKVCLTTVRCHRALKGSFNESHQIELGSGWINSGWVDCSQFSEEFFFKAMGYRVAEVSTRQWRNNPKRGSGVGGVVTRHLAERHLEMYCVEDSLAIHVRTDSVLNDVKVRRANPISAERFVEGERMQAVLAQHEPITAHLATIPERVESLRRVVESLYDHVDRLCVYLNGHQDAPPFLERPRIEIAWSHEHGDLGDAGKFFAAGKFPGYHLHCDDDLVYPPDYVHRTIRAIERYERGCVVSYHGHVLRSPFQSFRKSLESFRCLADVDEDQDVDVLGTGTLGYHASTIEPAIGDFGNGYMADVWFAAICQRKEAPRRVLAHRGDWIGSITHDDTLWRRMVRAGDDEQTRVLQEAFAL